MQCLHDAERGENVPGAVIGARRSHYLLPRDHYDEASFELTASPGEPLVPGAVTLLHSGVVYPSERDPTQFFAAIRRLSDLGKATPERLRVRFRPPRTRICCEKLAREHGIEAFIELLPPVTYRAAWRKWLRADALLVLQAFLCNEQIPAKLYEYLRRGAPILGLTDPVGDTAWVLRSAGIDTIARLDSRDEIAAALHKGATAVAVQGSAPCPTRLRVRHFPFAQNGSR